ncbi:hypothetical protein ACFWIP_21905 [Streptomyces anulatus]|uniref:hypothetical protein n=1 Tax=Streptomyces anulatus TaxID=1892 RepID=UPI00364725F2
MIGPVKAAQLIQPGEWVAIGHMAWQVVEARTENATTYLTWGNGTTSEFRASERVTTEIN